MRNLNSAAPIIALYALSVSTPAAAQPVGTEERLDSPFSVEISTGAEYDSNISVSLIDSNTGADDFAAVIDADLGFETELGENSELGLGYSFSQSLHSEFSSFDIQSHFASAELSHDFGDVDIGAAYRFIYTRLGGNGFLVMQQFSPYATKFFGKKIFARADYTYTDKDFENRVDRDATVHAGGGDVYFFINGIRTYIVAGYKYEKEDATDPQFDFQAHKVKARFSQRIPMGKRDAKLKLSWRYETRDYSSITPSIGVIRDDTRHKLKAALEIPVTDSVYTLLEYEYSDFASNLPSVDYTQNLVAARLGIRF